MGGLYDYRKLQDDHAQIPSVPVLVEGLSANSCIMLSGASTWNTATAALNVSSVISGAGTITKTGAGTLTLSGSSSYEGTTTVKSGTLAMAAGSFIGRADLGLTVGETSGDSGSLLIDGGHVQTQTTFVGNEPGSVGRIKINDGSLEVFNEFWVGGNPYSSQGGGQGSLEINGGYVSGFQGIRVGYGASGTGSMIMTSGTMFLEGGVTVGQAGGTGSVILSGGTASVRNITVGDSGTGTFTISGGSVTAVITNIGDGGHGDFLLDGGTLAGSSIAQIGVGGGVGSATVTSGTWTQANFLQIGGPGLGHTNCERGYASFNTVLFGALGDATVNISSGTLAVIGDTYIGGLQTTSGTGTVSVSGGLLSTTGTISLAAGKGTASLSISGSAGNRGVVSASRVVKDTGTATINVNGGVLQARQNESDFLSGFAAGDVTIGQRGAIIDTQAFAVGIAAAVSGTGGLTKVGSGTLALSGSNRFTGQTVVSEGTLVINGDNSAAGGVEVQFGAALGGTGKVSDLIVRNGGRLAPGESPGTLTVDGNLTLESSATLTMQFTGTGAGEFDQIAITGLFTAGGTLYLDVSYAAAVGDTFTIFTDGIAGRGWDAGSFTIDTNLGDGLSWNTSTLASDGTISIVAVPEPATAVLVGATFAGLAFARRRKSTKE